MYRWLIAVLVLGLVSLCAWRMSTGQAEEKDKEKETLAAAAKEKKEYSSFKEMEADFLKNIRAAETGNERKEVLQKASQEFLDFALKNPKAEERLEALSYILRMDQPETKKACEILVADYAKSPEIKQFLRLLANPTDENQTEVLQAVLDQNPSKAIQARACQTLLKSRESAVKQARQLESDKDLRKKIEKRVGKEAVQNLIENADKLEQEQKRYNRLMQKKYADYIVDLTIGKPAPEVISEDLEGNKVKLSDLRGKVVVLDIWATWCGPCREMIPHERKLVKKLQGKPFVLVSVSADNNREIVSKFIKKTPMPWTHWWNGPDGGIVEDWEVESFPTIYVLDHKGVIRYKDVREEEMDAAVETLLKEMDEEKNEKK